MSNEELIKIKGGSVINASIVNAFVRLIAISLELGRATGSAIRRSIKGSAC